jgi:DNA topoisomerase-1
VRVEGDTVVFDYPSKGGKRRVASVVDPEVRKIVAAMRRRRGGGPDLLAWREGRRWVDARSEDVNAYLKEQTGSDPTPRTSGPGTPPCSRPWRCRRRGGWPGPGRRATAPSRGRSRRSRTTSATPRAVCRKSYIDPRLFDRYRSNLTIAGALERLGDVEVAGEPAHHAIEQAVLDLISERRAERLELEARSPA